MIGRNADLFSAFQTSVEDAWEADDEEFLSLISKTVAAKTAKEVMQRHSSESQMAQSHKGSIRTSGKLAPGRGIRLDVNAESSLSLAQPTVERRIEQFQALINSPFTDLGALRKQSWSGIPQALRFVTWKLLCDYLPASYERRITTLKKKRKQYIDLNSQFFNLRNGHDGAEIFKQVQKDLVRMPMLQNRQDVFELFERVLFNWSVRHPGSGYVQGINDLLTPFMVVFLSEYTKTEMNPSGELRLSAPITAEQLQDLEADVFWCVSRLLDTIQDNYTFAQPGIQNNINKLSSLIERLDNELHRHLMKYKVEYLQFAFRWMNNLLIRELPLRCIIRLWDTYMAEPDGFSQFHVYVCAAFLLRFKDSLMCQNDFHSLLVYLQALPTHRWTNDDIEMVLAQAFQYKSLFSQAPKHLDYRRSEIL
ncbi:TBC1 domain family 2B [Echinococcus multilocularis]|uniref:TBC1 domain family 2B n=1 Tax=Echinococcus multilocularis TaxID=6211 RepID=A0A068YHM7_ECHMU|nr:TBC1 domain family 2B [Echinococcus multilocularis]